MSSSNPGSNNSDDGVDHLLNCKSSQRSSSNLDPCRGRRWWLYPHQQHKDSLYGELDILGAESGVLSAEFVHQTPKMNSENLLIEEYCAQIYNQMDGLMHVNKSSIDFDTHLRSKTQSETKDLKADVSHNMQNMPMKKLMKDAECTVNSLDLDSYGYLSSEHSKMLTSELDSSWIGVGKTTPWWHSTDKEVLASLVSLKSREHVENCDLPQPESKNLEKGSNFCLPCSEQTKFEEAKTEISSLSSVCINRQPNSSVVERCSLQLSDAPYSNVFSTPMLETAATSHSSKCDINKSELVEALCHSQTRAREAEKLAQQAYDEKEHIINLIFRQASYLFAYRLWVQILQLETLCVQLRNRQQSIYTHFPDLLPWVPSSGSQVRKGRRHFPRRKPRKARHKISKYAVAFAVGLSLAGAGLLLGWTMGWLFPV